MRYQKNERLQRGIAFLYKKKMIPQFKTLKKLANFILTREKSTPPPKKKIKIIIKLNIKMYIMIKSNRIPRGEEAG